MPTENLDQSILEQHKSVREAVGFLDLTDRGKIEVTGPDRITFLHAMISNDVVELSELAVRYGTFLTDRGKIVSDFFYYKLPEILLIDVSKELLPVMKETLEKYIIMDEVELEDLSVQRVHFSLQGPKASELVLKLFETAIPSEPYQVMEVDWEGSPGWLIAKQDLAESGCELIFSAAVTDSLKQAILKEGDSLGLAEISREARNILRLEAGIPWYGEDMDENRYPMEARLETAISLTKGCYLGQEVVSKAVHIGGVNKLLMGLKVNQPVVPVKGARVLNDEGTQIGAITSAAFSPRFERPIALAYLKSKFALPGDVCQVETGEGKTATAEIVEKFV
jgi:folate-binding protein YgfZ